MAPLPTALTCVHSQLHTQSWSFGRKRVRLAHTGIWSLALAHSAFVQGWPLLLRVPGRGNSILVFASDTQTSHSTVPAQSCQLSGQQPSQDGRTEPEPLAPEGQSCYMERAETKTEASRHYAHRNLLISERTLLGLLSFLDRRTGLTNKCKDTQKAEDGISLGWRVSLRLGEKVKA